MNQRDYLRREKEARIAAQKALEAEQRQAWVDAYLKWGPGHFGNPDQTIINYLKNQVVYFFIIQL